MEKILLTGGAGYIGSHMNKFLNEKGYRTVVFDNLCKGHREFLKWGEFVKGDLLNISDLERLFSNHKIAAVLHFAALSYVGESVEKPAEYYRNNICGTLNLLNVMKKYKVDTIVFSSSAAVYGAPKNVPIVEDEFKDPINPYGRTKLAIEWILRDYSDAYGLKYVALRYFNAAGADRSIEIGEWHEPETHLIPLVLDAAIGTRSQVNIFGVDYPTPDGTCIRDYIHVADLVSAHLCSLKYLKNGGKSDVFNLGIGRGYSVREVIDTVKKVTGKNFNVVETKRRPGDPPELVADSNKAQKVLKWQPEITNLSDIVETSWRWHIRLNSELRQKNDKFLKIYPIVGTAA